MAQPDAFYPGAQPGSLDPLGLITSGAVLPYVGGGANSSFLEAYSPVQSAEVHMFFFDPSCVRVGDSANLTLTANDVEFFRVDNLGTTPPAGLLTVAGVDGTGFFLQPTMAPVHLKVLWVNALDDFVRVIDPIALSTYDNDFYRGVGTWNPLRTGAAFWAPLETAPLSTVIYFVCPNTNIIGTASAATRAFATDAGFPPLRPAARAAGSPTPLNIRVYDDEENFLRDVLSTCECFTQRPVTQISNVYSSAVDAPFGTYTEVVGGTVGGTPAVCSQSETVTLVTTGVKNSGNPCDFSGAVGQVQPDGSCPSCTSQFRLVTPAVAAGGPFAFTGYRSIVAGTPGVGGGVLDVWNRLNGACRDAINGGQCQDAFELFAWGFLPFTPNANTFGFPTFGR
ncbi:MAG TPA: hypothetical protein VMT79_21170 [Candidatus Binatia bacterium]|nr:hypothetical protein [Candidatus Binatia bacterium]